MKKLLVIFALITLCALPSVAKKRATTTGAPQIEFESTKHDFGVIKEADGWVEHTYTFTNTGTAPLAITTVSTTCGCTKPEFTTKPIAPGKKGTVKLRFTPAGLKGEQTRLATVRTNVKGPNSKVTLSFSLNVIP